MSMRQRVNEAMDCIRQLTQNLGEEQYADFLEQLKFEIEAEAELCNWDDPDEE